MGYSEDCYNSEWLRGKAIGNNIEKIVRSQITKDLMLHLYGLHPVRSLRNI